MPGGIRTRNPRIPMILHLRPAGRGQGAGRKVRRSTGLSYGPPRLVVLPCRPGGGVDVRRESNPRPHGLALILRLRPARAGKVSGRKSSGALPLSYGHPSPCLSSLCCAGGNRRKRSAPSRWSRLHRERGASRPAGPTRRIRRILRVPCGAAGTQIAPPASGCAGGAIVSLPWSRAVRLCHGVSPGPPALPGLRIVSHPPDAGTRAGAWTHLSPRGGHALLPPGAWLRACAGEAVSSAGKAIQHPR